VLNIKLPSLNERKQDLEDLVLSYTLRKHPNFMSIIEKWIKEITKLLDKYHWNGNIRELENNLERFFAYLESPVNITKQDIINNLVETLDDNKFLSIKRVPDHESYQTIIKEAEINTIKGVLKKTNGNKKDAAKILGMSRSTLWRKLNETDASKL
jgi:propionate catabolism operon transcriptional regulator